MKKESIEDTARVLGRMYDGIEYRGFNQSLVETLGAYAGVPVWNGLTNEFHPTQMLADMLTIEENFGHLEGVNFVFMGDARNNVANSLMVASAKMGMNFTCCAPKDLWPNKELIDTCQKIAKTSGSHLTFEENVKEATKNADVIYTDVWVSMGEPDEVWNERIKLLKPYQVTKEVLNNANPNAIFLHCLPSFHDLKTTIGKEIYEKFGLPEMEVTNEVFESEHSKVFDEAENRVTALLDKRNSPLQGKDRDEVIHNIAIGAVKYADLSKNRMTDYVFDWDLMLSFDGNTAPYLQYAYSRIRSIFRKAEIEPGAIVLQEEAENDLATKLLAFEDTVKSVAEKAMPHLLCTYLFELSGIFMRFYEACPVLKGDVALEIKASRLALCDLTAKVLKQGLGLLGINTMEQM